MAATLIITVIYGVQLIYYCIFRTPLSLISVGGAGDAMQFWDIALEAILKNIAAVLLLFIPFAFMVLYRKKMTFREKKPPELSMVLAFCVMSYFFSVACVAFTGDEPASQNTLYFETFSPELSVDKLGVLTTIRLDVERLAAGALEEALLDRMCAETEERDIEDWYAGSNDKAGNTVWPGGIPDGTTGSSLSGTPGGTPDSAPMGGNDPADPDGLRHGGRRCQDRPERTG